MEIMCNFKIISYINVLNTVQQQIVNIILIIVRCFIDIVYG